MDAGSSRWKRDAASRAPNFVSCTEASIFWGANCHIMVTVDKWMKNLECENIVGQA